MAQTLRSTKMTSRRRSAILQAVVAGLMFGGVWLGRPLSAEAQARGTLQVTAQVVDTKASFDGLQAARVALRQAAAGTQNANIGTVSTLAQVSIAQPATGRSDLVVTIDYAKN
jgi:hypothetical protein